MVISNPVFVVVLEDSDVLPTVLWQFCKLFAAVCEYTSVYIFCFLVFSDWHHLNSVLLKCIYHASIQIKSVCTRKLFLT